MPAGASISSWWNQLLCTHFYNFKWCEINKVDHIEYIEIKMCIFCGELSSQQEDLY